MLEARGKLISEVSARLMEADAETLWVEIRELARNQDYPFAGRILEVGEHEHWTVTHVALALAHMLLQQPRSEPQRDDGVHEPPDHHEQALPEQTSIWLDGSIREPGLSPGNSSRVLPFSDIDMRTGNKDASLSVSILSKKTKTITPQRRNSDE
jgi:hypothetical protein